jgi:hypothetical protein
VLLIEIKTKQNLIVNDFIINNSYKFDARFVTIPRECFVYFVEKKKLKLKSDEQKTKLQKREFEKKSC